MITVKAAHLREGQEKSFVSLELSGDLELVQSQNTGRFYATARKCFISSTFDLPTAQLFVGKQIPGNIVRVQAEPYDYTLESGETITLAHSYAYRPDEAMAEPTMHEPVKDHVDELELINEL